VKQQKVNRYNTLYCVISALLHEESILLLLLPTDRQTETTRTMQGTMGQMKKS